MKQTKTPPLLVVIAVVLAAGLCASGYLNVIQNQRNADTTRQLQGTITDLQYQLNLDHQSPTPTPSAKPSAATPTPSPAAQTAVLAAQSLNITELGVKLTPSAPLADLKYNMIPAKIPNAAVAAFSSVSFSAKYPACQPGTALGQLVRSPKGNKLASSNVFVVTLGDYSYYYYAPTYTCASGAAATAEINSDRNYIKNTILKTLSQ